MKTENERKEQKSERKVLETEELEAVTGGIGLKTFEKNMKNADSRTEIESGKNA